MGKSGKHLKKVCAIAANKKRKTGVVTGKRIIQGKLLRKHGR
jgi:hypothetical protein